VPLHRFKLQWTAENYVTAANGATNWTTTGGETWVESTSEPEAISFFRKLLGSDRTEISVIN
jgi:hypothetical protein